MSLDWLVECALDKQNFLSVRDYEEFALRYLDFIESGGLQARIVSQNENHYRFFQYNSNGHYNITRPINSDLFIHADSIVEDIQRFEDARATLRSGYRPDQYLRSSINSVIYTMQQCIGATLDALPAGRTNTARKINGDLFERLMLLLIEDLGVDCTSGTINVPVRDDDGIELFRSSYQHDLLLNTDGELKAIGSVKTSSKDRIDKVFVDKYLYNKLTETTTPHFAIFLNDVQRKATRLPNRYGIASTFLTGHFKAYTMKLNPLDGVYYCDIRPNMRIDGLLASQIDTIDRFFCDDIWDFVHRPGKPLDDVSISEDTDIVPV